LERGTQEREPRAEVGPKVRKARNPQRDEREESMT